MTNALKNYPKVRVLLDHGQESMTLLCHDIGESIVHPGTQRAWIKIGGPRSHKMPGIKRYLGRRDLYKATDHGYTYELEGNNGEPFTAPDGRTYRIVGATLQHTPVRNEVTHQGLKYSFTDFFYYAVAQGRILQEALGVKARDWMMFWCGLGIGAVAAMLLSAIVAAYISTHSGGR